MADHGDISLPATLVSMKSFGGWPQWGQTQDDSHLGREELVHGDVGEPRHPQRERRVTAPLPVATF